MGKRNRVRRQSIRELPLIVGPLPLPDLPSSDDGSPGAGNGSAIATHGPEESLSVPRDRSDEGVEERVLAPADGEPLGS